MKGEGDLKVHRRVKMGVWAEPPNGDWGGAPPGVWGKAPSGVWGITHLGSGCGALSFALAAKPPGVWGQSSKLHSCDEAATGSGAESPAAVRCCAVFALRVAYVVLHLCDLLEETVHGDNSTVLFWKKLSSAWH